MNTLNWEGELIYTNSDGISEKNIPDSSTGYGKINDVYFTKLGELDRLLPNNLNLEKCSLVIEFEGKTFSSFTHFLIDDCKTLEYLLNQQDASSESLYDRLYNRTIKYFGVKTDFESLLNPGYKDESGHLGSILVWGVCLNPKVLKPSNVTYLSDK